jgi:hypothetical protein
MHKDLFCGKGQKGKTAFFWKINYTNAKETGNFPSLFPN